MSYPDPYHPQQQPPPGQYPPAPPGPQGYGYPQPPYYPPPGVPPQQAPKQDDGNSRVWRILDNLMFFATDASSQGLGNTARDRVRTSLMIFGIIIVAIAILIAVVVLMSK